MEGMSVCLSSAFVATVRFPEVVPNALTCALLVLLQWSGCVRTCDRAALFSFATSAGAFPPARSLLQLHPQQGPGPAVACALRSSPIRACCVHCFATPHFACNKHCPLNDSNVCL